MTNQIVLKGVVHGKTIELEDAPGLPDGQDVTVTVQPSTVDHERLPPGEGIRRSAGGWADAGADFDAWLEGVQRSR